MKISVKITFKLTVGSKFKSDLKRYKYDHSAIHTLDAVLRLLVTNTPLPAGYRDHSLLGKWQPAREFHIKPDLLLIYRINKSLEEIELIRIGSHSDLFKS